MREKIDEAKKRMDALTRFFMIKPNPVVDRALLEFLLTFSTFESLFCGNREFLSCKPYQNLDLIWSKPYFDFFVDRYVTDRTTNNRFDRHFHNSGEERWVKAKLLSKNSVSAEDMFLVVFKISYRFRNNLLHGNEGKAVDELPAYEDCFNQITEFMRKLIQELIKKEELSIVNTNP